MFYLNEIDIFIPNYCNTNLLSSRHSPVSAFQSSYPSTYTNTPTSTRSIIVYMQTKFSDWESMIILIQTDIFVNKFIY